MRLPALLSLVVSMLMPCLSLLAVPPAEEAAAERLDKSPRHAEYVDLSIGEDKTVRAYVVFPEVKDKAPVVIVIHEIYGLTPWIKSVADQLAADGFIAIAPDFLTGRGPDGGGTDSFKTRDEVTQAVRAITPDYADRVLNGAKDYATKLPAATSKFGVVGYCWGGMQAFRYATTQPALGAAVVYYGTSPKDGYDKISAPVLGLYGEDDARVNATIPDAQAQMKSLDKTYLTHTYTGAGHGFLRNQSARDGANLKAAQQAWPVTIEFLKKHLAAN